LFYKTQGAALVTGVDASKELINIAGNKYPNIIFKNGLFDSLPIKDNTIDCVFSKYALQTTPDLESAFKEVYRVLKSGGEFMFLVVHPIRQLYEKKKNGKDYFKQEIVDSVCFDGLLTFQEPTHTMKEYFSEFMLQNFTLELFEEKFDPAAEKIVDTYPGYMILKWRKK
jgi:ubiquinone/menaquinone biosynthesis C-methylase UbiE